jgi:hypothetical protein
MQNEKEFQELQILLQELEGKTKATTVQLVQLFNLHNIFYPKNLEYAKHCTPCVVRVLKRCKAILNKYKDEL